MKILYFILPLFVFQNCEAQSTKSLEKNKDNNSLLWEISGNGLKKPSYLYGTFHMMCTEDIHLSDNLKKAIKGSDEVYFEMDLDDPSLMMSGLLQMTMKNSSLKDLYTPEEYERVKNYFNDSLKLPFEMLQKMKPLFLQALLYPKMMPCKNTSGIDQEILKIAQTDKKPISGLETMEFQASIFDSIPYESQAKDLLKSIDSLQNNEIEFNKMLNVYKEQKLGEIESMFNEVDLGAGEHQAILLDNRNKNWVSQLIKIMPQKNVFVAVGAGHLPGKMGVINLLKNAGYTVTPIVNK